MAAGYVQAALAALSGLADRAWAACLPISNEPAPVDRRSPLAGVTPGERLAALSGPALAAQSDKPAAELARRSPQDLVNMIVELRARALDSR